jgi:hypothetical protein
MKNLKWLFVFAVLASSTIPTRADTTVSYTGTLASSSDVFETTLTLASPSNVTLQTFGFGGGTNQAGTVIAPGGTDPFLAIFSGLGDSAAILTDGSGNPFGTSLSLTNNAGLAGCPPAGTENIGGADTCGDVRMSIGDLGPGTYTIVLSDGLYFANAIFDNGTLGEGFTDFTGGVFCNAEVNGVDCPNTSGAFALDIISAPSIVPAPEPSSLLLLAAGFAGVWRLRQRCFN